jgi:hypothetical protein
METKVQDEVRVKIDGASKRVGVPVGTLRFWRATNQGPRSYVVVRRLWYDVADLDEWLAAQRAESVRGGVA